MVIRLKKIIFIDKIIIAIILLYNRDYENLIVKYKFIFLL